MRLRADLGDSHNYGRQVQRIEFNGISAFRKPRTVFWEQLFFGNLSALQSITNENQFRNNISLPGSPGFFQLVCLSESDSSGTMAAVERNQLSKDIDSFINFGHLLGYAFAAGIQDLHSDNVLRTQFGLQPVDAEAVLFDMQLPDQTHLLSRLGSRFKHSTLEKISSTPNSIPIDQFIRLLDGFVSMMNHIAMMSEQFISSINMKIDSRACPPPIRVLLRPTEEYYLYNKLALNGEPVPAGRSGNWVDAEVEQLNRGDIPFFYTYIGLNKILYHSDSYTDREVGEIPFVLDPSFFAQSPEFIFKQERLLNKLLPQGVLYLLKHHLCPAWMGSHNSDTFKLQVSQSTFQVELNGVVHRSSRVPRASEPI